jgi:hypothetical protein
LTIVDPLPNFSDFHLHYLVGGFNPSIGRIIHIIPYIMENKSHVHVPNHQPAIGFNHQHRMFPFDISGRLTSEARDTIAFLQQLVDHVISSARWEVVSRGAPKHLYMVNGNIW